MGDFIEIKHPDGSIEYINKDYDQLLANMVVRDLHPVPEDIANLSETELQARILEDHKNFIRAERDRRLAECDWTQGQDSPLSEDKKNAWKIYRQTLRDLPASITEVNIIQWPEKP